MSPPLDPDPLAVPEHPKPYRLVPDSPRRGCSVLGFLLLAAFAIMLATPRGAPQPKPHEPPSRTVSSAAGTLLGAPPGDVASSRERPAEPGDDGLGVRSGGSASMPVHDASAVTFEGTLSWVSPSYGRRYLALPQPRGTRACICGPAGCVTRVSTDYGPDQRLNPDRIADLSAADWQAVCGVPLAFGLCPGTVTLK